MEQQAQVSTGALDTLAYAQSMLNANPDSSPFWDSSAGQDVLAVAKQNNLAATNSNRERSAIHAKAMQGARATLRPEILVAALQQIERLSLEADRNAIDVASMLGEIARDALADAAA